MSAVSEALPLLADEQSRLAQQWETACGLWRDSVQREFEATYWTPVEQDTERFHRSLVALDRVLTEARRSVE
jgi:hypothetical protein